MKKTETKPKKKTPANLSQQPVRPVKTKTVQHDGSVFGVLNAFLDKRLNIIFWILFGMTFLFCILLFDIRFSLTGDDSAYVIRASDFIHHFTYPGFQGPLYPMVLSPLVGLFGISFIPLKSLSVVFMMGFFFFTYKAFKNRIPSILLVSILLLVSINSFIIYYASQTYSETFFMFVQAITFYVLFKNFLDPQENKSTPALAKNYLLLGFWILCLGLTRSIGFSALASIPAYFALRGQWKNLLMVVATSIAFIVIFQGIKFLLWGSAEFTLSSQGSGLMNKDYYKPSNGKEDLAGFIVRIAKNSNSYISRHFYAMMGLRPYDIAIDPLTGLNIATWIVFFGGVGVFLKKNRYLLFVAIYTFIILMGSFFILQTKWDQSRLIIPYMTFLVLILLSTFYYLLTIPKLKKLQWLFPAGVVILFGFSMGATSKIMADVRKIDGIYYGLSPDWENYVKISKWASDNLPKEAVVACRKPSISFIYGSKGHFFGITQIPNYSITKLFNDWKIKKAHYTLIYTADVANKEVTTDLYKTYKNGLFADIIRSGQVFNVVSFPDSTREKTLAELTRLKIRWRSNVDSLRNVFKENDGFYVVYPDSLLNILKKAKVTHVLTANLRGNPNEKTKQTVNTVERFMGIITDKYPSGLTKVAQLGTDENEPACVYRIEYSRCAPL